jgi:hypothetical protein
VVPAIFEPACDAYQALPGGAATSTFFRARSADDHPQGGYYAEIEVVSMSEQEQSQHPYYPIEVFRNVTNQPIFANGSTCDDMVRLFNSSMSRGEYEPVFVRGSVRANVRPLEGAVEWRDAYGVQLATPFVENNYLDCATMKGYSGTGGDGDSDLGLEDR